MTGPSSGGSASPGTDPTTVDGIVAALRHDRIVLSPSLGNGHTTEIDAALQQQLAQSTVPVYVVLTRTPTDLDTGSSVDPDQQLASLLHARLGGDGVYYVHTTEGGSPGDVFVYGHPYPGVIDPSTQLSLGIFAGLTQIEGPDFGGGRDDAPSLSNAGDASVLLSLTSRPDLPDVGDDPDHFNPVLSEAQVQSLSTSTWLQPDYVSDSDLPEPATTGLLFVVGVGVAVSVAVVALRVLRAVAALRRRPTPQPADLDALRAAARSSLTDLDALMDGEAGRRADVVSLGAAERGRDEARALVDHGDPLDLVGARVLALVAASRVRGRETYRPCYVNPTHGRATTRTSVGGGVVVPVCRRCERDADAHRPVDALLDAHGRPYYRGRSRWARTGFGAVGDLLDSSAGRRP